MWWHCHPRSPPPTHALLQLVFHSLGSSAEDDVVVYEDPVHPNWRFDSTVSTDGTVLLLTAHEGCDPVETLYYVNLTPGAAATSFQVIKLIDNMGMAKGVMVPTHNMPPHHTPSCSSILFTDAGYTYLGNDGRRFFFMTNLNAPRYRVVSIDLPAPGSSTETDAAALAEAATPTEVSGISPIHPPTRTCKTPC